MTDSLCESLREIAESIVDTSTQEGKILLRAADEIERLRRDLLQSYLLHLYKPEGVDIWLADAKKKGQTLEQQLQRAEQLVTGAYA